MTKVFNTALVDEVIINDNNGNSYKLLPMNGKNKTGKSPFENVKGLYEAANEYLMLTDEVKAMARQFQQRGIREYDSLHLADAEKNNYDFG